MEAVSTDKYSDLTINNTSSQSSVSFSPVNLSSPLTILQNLGNFIDSNFDRIHSTTSIIGYVKTLSLQTKGTSCNRLLVNANYLADDIFWPEEILFLRMELKNKQKTINKLFNILH